MALQISRHGKSTIQCAALHAPHRLGVLHDLLPAPQLCALAALLLQREQADMALVIPVQLRLRADNLAREARKAAGACEEAERKVGELEAANLALDGQVAFLQAELQRV